MDNNFNSYTLLELKRMINHFKDFHTINYTVTVHPIIPVLT